MLFERNGVRRLCLFFQSVGGIIPSIHFTSAE